MQRLCNGSVFGRLGYFKNLITRQLPSLKMLLTLASHLLSTAATKTMASLANTIQYYRESYGITTDVIDFSVSAMPNVFNTISNRFRSTRW